MKENEILIESKFEKYLVDNKYPVNRINKNTKIKTGSLFDFVIYAKDNTTPLIVFEIKTNENLMQKSIEQFKNSIKTLDNNIECYFVIKTEKGFEFYDAKTIDSSNIKNSKTQLPSYEALNNNAERNKLDNAKKEIKNLSIWLFITSIVSVLINIAVLIIDAVTTWTFNTYKIIIVLSIPIIFMIPFISEIKIKNVLYIKMKDNIEKE